MLASQRSVIQMRQLQTAHKMSYKSEIVNVLILVNLKMQGHRNTVRFLLLTNAIFLQHN